MTEREQALMLAQHLLDERCTDPDDHLRLLSRQLIRLNDQYEQAKTHQLLNLSSEDICEALVRHVEVTGSEIFEKGFINGNGVHSCTVFCIVGQNSAAFTEAIHEWLANNNFKLDE